MQTHAKSISPLQWYDHVFYKGKFDTFEEPIIKIDHVFTFSYWSCYILLLVPLWSFKDIYFRHLYLTSITVCMIAVTGGPLFVRGMGIFSPLLVFFTNGKSLILFAPPPNGPLILILDTKIPCIFRVLSRVKSYFSWLLLYFFLTRWPLILI